MPANLSSRSALTLALIITLTISVHAQDNTRIKLPSTTNFAGIEVGSKGVKMSIIDLAKGKASEGFTILKDTSVNTDFITFSASTADATLNSLAGLFNTAVNEYQIPTDHIYTVISSGVKVQADKDNQQAMIDGLIKSFRERIKEPQRKVDVVDVTQEAKLSHLGIIPESRRYTTFLIDIGSGNTKGGYFPLGNTSSFKLFQLGWGTKSVANATEKRTDEFDRTMVNYEKQMRRVLKGVEESDIIYAINASGAYAMSDNIAFSGGIAWAVATLLHPEQLGQSTIAVSFAEVRDFSERIVSSYKSLSDTALLRLNPDIADKQVVAREIRRVNAVFDQRSLLAGTGLLLKVMRQFASVYESKQFVLIKNGQVGWISAYVDEQNDH